MNEAEWLASTDPAAMLELFRRTDSYPSKPPFPVLSDRKLRLFNGGTADLLRCIVGNPFRPWSGPFHTVIRADGSYRTNVPCLPTTWLTPTVLAVAQVAYEERGGMCRRCKGKKFVYQRTEDDTGFGRATITQDCPDCHGTGKDGYLDRTNLLVLAEALEDAGCCGEVCSHCLGKGTVPALDDGRSYADRCPYCHGARRQEHPLLEHLRGPGPHVRGCWAVDLILGKE